MKLKQQNSKGKGRKGRSVKNELPLLLIRMATPRSLRGPRDSTETRKLNAC
jgi:hypothetical protein